MEKNVSEIHHKKQTCMPCVPRVGRGFLWKWSTAQHHGKALTVSLWTPGLKRMFQRFTEQNSAQKLKLKACYVCHGLSDFFYFDFFFGGGWGGGALQYHGKVLVGASETLSFKECFKDSPHNKTTTKKH